MNILITNIFLSNNSGTELYTKELALGLKRLGHQVEIYTFFPGRLSADLIANNINVVDDLRNIKIKPDIIHAHHNLLAIKALAFFRNTPAILFIHDRTSNFDHPYKHKNIIKYLAVDENCKERYSVDGGFDPQDVDIICNWYNPERFTVRETINKVPRRALIFSNYKLEEREYEEISLACSDRDIVLDIIGSANGNQCDEPEKILKNYDIVFAKGKAAIEAIASGACLIVCDFRGLGGMVTPDNVEYFRVFNFGMKLMKSQINRQLISAEILRYDKNDILKVSNYVREKSNYFNSVAELEKVYGLAIGDFNRGQTGKYRQTISNLMYIYIKNSRFLLVMFRRKFSLRLKTRYPAAHSIAMRIFVAFFR